MPPEASWLYGQNSPSLQLCRDRSELVRGAGQLFSHRHRRFGLAESIRQQLLKTRCPDWQPREIVKTVKDASAETWLPATALTKNGPLL